jgi:hypothetical protein
LINLLGLHADIAPWFETKCLVEALRWIKVLGDQRTAELESTLINPRDITGFSLDAVAKRMLFHGRYTDDRFREKTGSGKAAHESYPLGSDCVGYLLAEYNRLLAQWYRQIDADGVDANSAAAHTGELIRKLGSCHLEGVGGRIWANKTPEIPRFGQELRMCLGKCKIVHLIRDGREVALSGARLNWGAVSALAYYWAGLIEESRNAAKGHEEDYLEIRFERLVREPDREVRKILDFLDVPPDATIVERYERMCGRSICADERALKIDELKKDRSLMAEISKVAGDMLEELGYLD